MELKCRRSAQSVLNFFAGCGDYHVLRHSTGETLTNVHADTYEVIPLARAIPVAERSSKERGHHGFQACRKGFSWVKTTKTEVPPESSVPM
jgi:hypothetical protein